MERFLLDQTKFDAIIVGSSLSQTLLAASLSRAGKRVLLLDPASNYGTHQASIRLAELRSFFGLSDTPTNAQYSDMGNDDGPSPPSLPSSESSSQEWNQFWSKALHRSNLKAEQIISKYVEAEITTSTFVNAEEAVAEKESTKEEILANSRRDDLQQAELVSMSDISFLPFSSRTSNLGCAPFIATSDNGYTNIVEDVKSDVSEDIYTEITKRSSAFSIDLTPQLLLASSPLIDVLVRTDTTMYVEFKAIDDVITTLPEQLRKESEDSSLFSGFLSVLKSSIGTPSPLAPSTLVESNIALEGVTTAGISDSILDTTTLPSRVDEAHSKLWKVPSSRGEVFQDSVLSLEAKHCLMTCMHILLHDKTNPQTRESHLETYEAFKCHPLSALLDHLNIPALLRMVLLNAIILAPFEPISCFNIHSATLKDSTRAQIDAKYFHAIGGQSLLYLTTAAASARLTHYMRSVGRYTRGAYIYPSYGFSDLLQAFVHLSCVYGSTCVLRMRPSSLVYSKGECIGIVTTAGQFIQSQAVFVSPAYWNMEQLQVAKNEQDKFASDMTKVMVSRAIAFSKKKSPKSSDIMTDSKIHQSKEVNESEICTSDTSTPPVTAISPSLSSLSAPSLLFIPSSSSSSCSRGDISKTDKTVTHTAPVRMISLNHMTETCPESFTVSHFSVPMRCSFTPQSTPITPSLPTSFETLSPIVEGTFRTHRAGDDLAYVVYFDQEFLSTDYGVFPLEPKDSTTSSSPFSSSGTQKVYLISDSSLHDVDLDIALRHAETAFKTFYRNIATKETMPSFFAPRKADGTSLDGENVSDNDENTESLPCPVVFEDGRIVSETIAIPTAAPLPKQEKNIPLDKAAEALNALDADLAGLEGLNGLDGLEGLDDLDF